MFFCWIMAFLSNSRYVVFCVFTIQAVLLVLILSYTNSLNGVVRVFSLESKTDKFEAVPFDFNPFQNVIRNETRNETRANVTLTNGTISPTRAYSLSIGIRTFPNLKDKFKIPRLENSRVPRIIKHEHYQTLMNLLNLTTRVLEEHGIEYSMAYGTLIGSYLMHDMIPWDDDVDIFVHNKTKAKVMELFKDARHYGIRGHHHYKHPGQLFKVFFNSSKDAGGYPWNWPFIDIVSFVDKGSNLKAVQRGANLVWSKDSWYPLHLRPFGPLWLPAPRHPWVFLTAKYKSFKCKSSGWNHQRERGQRSKESSCSNLVKEYPFVKRSAMANITMETLVLNGKEMYDIFINEPYRKQKTLFGW